MSMRSAYQSAYSPTRLGKTNAYQSTLNDAQRTLKRTEGEVTKLRLFKAEVEQLKKKRERIMLNQQNQTANYEETRKLYEDFQTIQQQHKKLMKTQYESIKAQERKTKASVKTDLFQKQQSVQQQKRTITLKMEENYHVRQQRLQQYKKQIQDVNDIEKRAKDNRLALIETKKCEVESIKTQRVQQSEDIQKYCWAKMEGLEEEKQRLLHELQQIDYDE
ncbi:hypothetical protein SS50377_23699 [Spironucleus salmonicida]|uniref:Uncharacterized protein n=1 Tax=Spironucleus salmonicida TaxID=348837 RepID=V6LYA6_9EUKA|nr:hypothetical protein SS50377_23699 [Spironucleus salmonicida]|eukprot:EST48681.1 Hypothetical protein SS50377_11294 [Spironucleus salmonicida]